MSAHVEEMERVETPAFSPDDHPLPLQQLLKTTLRIIIPTDVSNFLWMSAQTVTLAFVGRYLGALAVAQYSAGLIVFNMMGFSIVQGFGAAIDTISSQAYGRDKRSSLVGETMQMALAFNLVLGLLICILFWNIGPLANWVFGEEVGPGVSHFLKFSPLYMMVQVVSGIMSKTMFAQKVPEIVAAANLVAACVSPVANYFLTPLGLHGAALSLFASVGCCCVTHTLCCVYHPRVIVRHAPWPSPRLLSREAWAEFFRVALPSVLATCAEWWAFEVQAVLAAQISPLALAVHGVAMNLVALLFSIALGVCVTASVVVGNSLGGMRPVQAKQYAYFVFALDVVLGAITAFLMGMFGGHIARIFSTEEAVVSAVEGIMPFVILCHVGDSFQFCLQGIFRGAGRQKQVGIAVLATLWAIGVPASIILVKVVHTGVKGCIGGLLVGFVFEIPVLFYWMTKFNWQKLALKAQRGYEVAEYAVEEVTITTDESDVSVTEKPQAPVFVEQDAIISRSARDEELPVREAM